MSDRCNIARRVARCGLAKALERALLRIDAATEHESL
jgi:hypothetical protein